MSASDAAPLPRLGEVFFDVRGSSRSMRLSWYADTGVAVFSIWQGGMCTGTFRLPIGDLPRMIEILQRGPDEPQPRAHSREHRWAGPEPAGTGQREVPARLHYPGPDGRYPDEPRTGYSPRSLGRDIGEYQQPGGGQPGEDDFGSGAYRDYQPPGPRSADSAGHRDEEGGYGQERFVPPYVRSAAGDYPSDIPARPAGRPDDPMREAYRPGQPDPLSGAADYPQPSRPPPEYPDGPQYRLPEYPAPQSRGRHGKYQAGASPEDAEQDRDPGSGIDSPTRDYPAWPRG